MTGIFNKKNYCKYTVGSPFSLRFDNVQLGSHLQTSGSVPSYNDTVKTAEASEEPLAVKRLSSLTV